MSDTVSTDLRVPQLVHLPLLALLAYVLYRVAERTYRSDLPLIVGLAGVLGTYLYSAVSSSARSAGRGGLTFGRKPALWELPIRAAVAFLVAAYGFALVAESVGESRVFMLLFGAIVGLYSSLLVDRTIGRLRKPPEPVRHVAEATPSATPDASAPRAEGDLPEEEERALVARLTHGPVDEQATRRAIEILRHAKRYEGATALYDRLLSIRPRDYNLIVEKAEMYREMGDRRRYIETIRQAERIQAETSFEHNLGKSTTVVQADIRGIGFFDNFTWAFQPTVNVLLGKNGYGKSHLLRAIVATLQNDVEVTHEFVEHAPEAALCVDVRRGEETVRTVRKAIVFEESFGKMPVLAIPDMRYINKSETTLAPGAPLDLVSQGAEHFMKDQSFESVILTFLYEICIDYFDGGKTFDLPVFRLIEKTLEDLTGSTFRFHDVRRLDSARLEIRVTTEGNESTPLPIQKASQGTLSVVSMAGLIFKYLAKLHPRVAGADVTKQQGIVVIDEIDAHLHPVWQQRVLQLFRDTFPQVQFIVTAHTPLVVAGCRSREVSILERRDGGFRVRVLDQHFIGATAADMYQEIFDVEEKDMAFLQLKAMAPDKERIEKRVADLEVRDGRSSEQEASLRTMKDQLYYMREVEQVRDKRETLEDVERERQTLELQASDLRGEVVQLKATLERKEQVAEALDVSGVVGIVREFIEANPGRARDAEPFAKYLSRQGGHKEAASLLEALHRSEPKNLSYMKGLAVQYQALEDYPKATEILRRAQSEHPGDTSVQAALRHLDAVQGRTGAGER